MKVDFSEKLDSDGSKRSAPRSRRSSGGYPSVRHVYLDATASSREQPELAKVIQDLADADADGDQDGADELAELERPRHRDAAAREKG